MQRYVFSAHKKSCLAWQLHKFRKRIQYGLTGEKPWTNEESIG